MKFFLIRSVLLITGILFFYPLSSFSVEKKISPKGDLVSGRLTSGRIDLSGDGTAYQTYQFRVPADAFAIRLTVSNSSADLDIFVKRGEEIKNYDSADYSSKMIFKSIVIFFLKIKNFCRKI